jgi:hypothetical protein
VPDLSLKPTLGLAHGETIQFALGRWPGDVGAGVALTEEAFDTIEPHLRRVWPQWDPKGRYGVTELPSSVTGALVQALRIAASQPATSTRDLFSQLSDWLEAHGNQPVSILGI